MKFSNLSLIEKSEIFSGIIMGIETLSHLSLIQGFCASSSFKSIELRAKSAGLSWDYPDTQSEIYFSIPCIE